MRIRIAIYIISVCLFFSCSDDKHDGRLTHISEIVSASPQEALSSLDTIDYGSLSDKDKHFYDFLTIKANDKAYISHTSDSLFMRVRDYYSNHSRELYPEVLYYGGRVYSDLGDYPTALKYFQAALDLLPAETDNPELRGYVLSQTGGLLNNLRLYKEAIPYVEGSLELDVTFNDSINEVYDLQLLGSIYERAHEYDKAEKYFFEALDKSRYMPESFGAKSRMRIAGIKYRKGEIDSALLFIRNTPDEVKPITRNSALARGAEIYLAAGMNDSAYHYALELVNSKDNINKKSGYSVLLSPELRPRLHPDTIYRYYNSYLALLESYLNENENELAVNQQSLYNYELHEKGRHEAEKSNATLMKWIIVVSFFSLVMAVAILWMKNRNKNNIIRLREALENVSRLRESLSLREDNNTEKKTNIETFPAGESQVTVKTLRDRLRHQFLSLYNENCSKPYQVSHLIIQSEAYRKLQDLIVNGEQLKDSDPLWRDIEAVVLSESGQFIERLHQLSGGRLTSNDLHTALLIKCGVAPKQMAVLLNRSKGAIVSRRESLCLRMFDEKMGVKVIDGVIRLL